jgi:hypothetical protein
LLQTIAPVEARITRASRWMPRGYAAPDEARLETFGPKILPDRRMWEQLRKWWLAHEQGANTPNWDIALACEIDGRPGAILVEAKANVPELAAGGKLVRADASEASTANHRRIGAAIAEACAGLRHFNEAIAISCDSHYQLSNRIAFTWKLATLGVPTVLVYLGFVGDEGIRDAGEPFRSDVHWQQVFSDYARSVTPQDLFGRRLECGDAPAWFLIRSRPVLSPSPPAEHRKGLAHRLPDASVHRAK